MLARLRKTDEDQGFTLIELLVVILIIGILAAIAIPTFLNQRRKGWDASAQATLKSAATAQESFITSNTTYATATSGLEAEGYNGSANITLTIVGANANGYCMTAVHSSNTANVWQIASGLGTPQLRGATGVTDCTATTFG